MRIANAAESQVGPKSPVMYLSPVVELMNTLMGLCSQMLQERKKKKKGHRKTPNFLIYPTTGSSTFSLRRLHFLSKLLLCHSHSFDF